MSTEPLAGTETGTGRRPDPARRGVLRAAAASPLVLAGCGAGEDAATDVEDASTGTAASGDSTVLAQVSDVPVGGSVFLRDAEVIVTQPAVGELRAFESRCPHQGCAVSGSEEGQLVCPCHGSRFDLDTGEVLQGPAERGLRPRPVRVRDDAVVLEEGR
ncbi:Rieske (2Fe-2S) protein [Ornithinimicrobium sediminis]|uniref:Rieske (2Fe-2S) protein n=1 Tax=Ornithinimicrobium sediminis TaxID=2904603 RepID=UPI001E2B7B71|nr:Rieske (2Fe-2S) protein [Ornithinimicrobium sediminis]MCE0487594.1 Rieske (2Fe-2S) protein [Ornithinimicrobium sediminis]